MFAVGLVPVADLIHDIPTTVKWMLSGICTVAALFFFAQAAILIWQDEELAPKGDRRRKMIGLTGMIICGAGFIVFAAYYFWPSKVSETTIQNAGSVQPGPQTRPETRATPEPTGVHKYIVEGLMKARDELLAIKKEDLSCDALAQWQGHASTATRLAHANGIGIHNPITQHLSACQNITDTEMLNAIRMSIVGLLDQRIQAARAGGG